MQQIHHQNSVMFSIALVFFVQYFSLKIHVGFWFWDKRWLISPCSSPLNITIQLGNNSVGNHKGPWTAGRRRQTGWGLQDLKSTLTTSLRFYLSSIPDWAWERSAHWTTNKHTKSKPNQRNKNSVLSGPKIRKGEADQGPNRETHIQQQQRNQSATLVATAEPKQTDPFLFRDRWRQVCPSIHSSDLRSPAVSLPLLSGTEPPNIRGS